MTPSSFPLLDARGKSFALLATRKKHLRHAGQMLERAVEFEFEGERFALRLCAVRKSLAAEAAAQRHARYERARKRGVVRETTLELAAFVCVLTSLPSTVLSTAQVLDLYRCRWQVELAFKRLKSLLAAGHLPKRDPPSCRAWMQAKVLIALLTDKLILESELFSPWVTRCEDESRWNCFIEAKDSLLHALSLPLSLQHLRPHGRRIGQHFHRPRPRRQRQMQRLGKIGMK